MGLTNISITPQFGNSTVTAINCGTSVPRLGGTIDLSAFPSLTGFTCNYNDITSITGYAQNSNIKIVDFSDNLVTGSIPNLNALSSGLVDFVCHRNRLSGTIPSLSGFLNLRAFSCFSQSSPGGLTGTIPSLSGLTNLEVFGCHSNLLSGTIPSLRGLVNLTDFSCDRNPLTGPIPSLSGLISLKNFACYSAGLTGSIPSLSGSPGLQTFLCDRNALVGSIPSLRGLVSLTDFNCRTNLLSGNIPSLSGLNSLQFFHCWNQLGTQRLTGFDGGPVSNTLGNFQAQNNQLNQSSVNGILSAFVVANSSLTGAKILNVGGTGNVAPSYTGGVTTTSAGTNFTRSGTLVTANVTGHGHVTGNIVTIDGITPTAFQGTFAVTRITDNQFQYTTLSSGAATGAGTATMRRTTNSSDGYASYQNLALVSRTGGPWTITINQP